MTMKVQPTDKGWEWSDDSGDRSGKADDRSTAIRDARAAAGGKTFNLTDPETDEVVGQRTEQPREQVLLLNQDGDVVGELDAAPAAPDSETTVVGVEPLSEEGSS